MLKANKIMYLLMSKVCKLDSSVCYIYGFLFYLFWLLII
jgi:hypothetical protein